MFYFRNGRNQGRRSNHCGNCSSNPQPGRPGQPTCPPPGSPDRPCPPPKPPGPQNCPDPPPHSPEACGKKEEHEKKDDKKENKKDVPKCVSHRECPGRRDDRDCRVCREIRPCCDNNRNCISVNCPDLLRWALWSSGFFRCDRCEKSGWQRKRGGSGFC